MTAPRPLIDHNQMLDVLGIDGELLLGAAEAALPAAARNPVPGCPGLTFGETVRHVGSVHRVARWVAEGGPPEHQQRTPVDGNLVGFVRTGLAELTAELARHDPAQPCDTWWPGERTHGFDIQAAAGVAVDPVEDAVALDRIDEVLFLWLGYRLGQLGMSSPQRGAVGLSAAGQHWLAQFEPGRSNAQL